MRAIVTGLILGLLFVPAFGAPRQVVKSRAKAAPTKSTVKKQTPPPGMMAAPFALPAPKSRGSIRGPVFLPKGAKNVALNRPVTSSGWAAFGGGLPQIVDGVKASFYGNGVTLNQNSPQWVQIDLQRPFIIHGILVWHNFFEPRIYRDVIVQLADNADFTSNVRTVFNNDRDNSSGLGAGKDQDYLEDFQGHWIPIKSQTATYVRLYSRGSNVDPNSNEYAEVEVWATLKPGMMEAPFVLPPPSYLG